MSPGNGVKHCGYCGRLKSEHVNDKCLFASTEYVAKCRHCTREGRTRDIYDDHRTPGAWYWCVCDWGNQQFWKEREKNENARRHQ